MGNTNANSVCATAEYLADREAVTGSARDSFLRILAEDFQYQDEAIPIGWRAWLLSALLAGFLALVIDAWRPAGQLPSWLWIGWPMFSCVGVAFALAFKRSKRVRDASEPELQWRVYCLLVRPLILTKHPGLLDRNLSVYRGTVDKLALTPLSSVHVVMKESRPEMWRAALVGLWVGMAVLLVLRLAALVQSVWSISLPIAAAVLGPIVWTLWQWVAFKAVSVDRRFRDQMGSN